MKKNRILALLLCAVMVLSLVFPAAAADGDTEVCSCAAEGSDHAEDCPLYASAEEETSSVLTAELGDFSFSVRGNIPTGAELVISKVEAGAAEYIRNSILSLENLSEGYTGTAYDITILYNGEKFQPDDTVTVTVNGTDTTAESDVTVYHLSNTSAEDIYRIMQEEMGIAALRTTVSGPATAADVISSEISSSVGEGYIQFITNSFSVFYIVAGTSDNGTNQWDTSIVELPSENSTYYVEPGTVIKFSNGTFSGNGSNGITRSQRTITVSEEAAIGATAEFTVNSRLTLTFIVATHETIINGAIETYPVYLALKTDASTGIPSEPGISTGSYNRYNAAFQSSWSNTFASSANGIISPEIADELVISVDGSSTTGLYDATGALCLKYISGINWDSMLTAAVNARATASDGTRVTNNNKENYTVVPYVIKLMSESGTGWHIDCAVVPKSHVILSYDINLKNYVITGTTPVLPNAETGISPMTTNVGVINGVDVNDTLQAKIDGGSYDITFKGWSTDPNATTATYLPGDSITIEENTVLYAVWTGKKEVSGITITKQVIGVGAIPSETAFAFTVTDSLGVTKEITLSASNNWTATITDLEPGTCTVSETKVDIPDHTLISVMANNTVVTDNPTITITLEDEKTTSVTYVNTYEEDEVTIKYVAETGGSVSMDSETLKVLTETATGSTATPTTGYSFIGWYNESGAQISTDTSFVPEKVGGKNVAATYYAKFVENEVTINYVAVGPAGVENFGTVSRTTETVKVLTGDAQGSEALPNSPTFKFVGWYSDKDCTNLITTAAEYDPAKVDGKNVAATYYAKFEYNLTTLTISKKVSGTVYDEDDTFIFQLKQGDKLLATFTLRNGQSVTIKDVTVGATYTVTELNTGNRYTVVGNPDKTVTIQADASQNVIAFTNEANETKWLSATDVVKNVFGSSSEG